MHIGIGVNFVLKVFIHGKLISEFISIHGLIKESFIFLAEQVVFLFDVCLQFHGPEIPEKGFRQAGEKVLYRRHNRTDRFVRNAKGFNSALNMRKYISGSGKDQDKGNGEQDDSAQHRMGLFFLFVRIINGHEIFVQHNTGRIDDRLFFGRAVRGGGCFRLLFPNGIIRTVFSSALQFSDRFFGSIRSRNTMVI